ncbi:MAG: glycosyltransferase family 2 protein [Bdellovibrionia bacterium]
MQKIEISVITPVFNAEKYLKQTIESVQSQTFTYWELILVIDSKSSDQSLSIAIEASRKDDRIKVLRSSIEGGVSVNRNLGLEAAQGNYVCFLDADDIWLEEKLEVQHKFAEHYEAEFTYTSFGIIDRFGKFTNSIRFAKYAVNSRDLFKNNCIGCSTVMIKKDFLGTFRFREGHHEDLDLWIRLLGVTRQAYPIREVLSLYRVIDGSRSSNKIICAKWRWDLMRRHRLSLAKQILYMISYLLFAVWKRSLVGYNSKSRPYSHIFCRYSSDRNMTVSVIMPTFNSEKTVYQAVMSVLLQTYQDLELIIVDDGSKDSTCEVINSIKDSRIITIKNVNNIGAAASRNRGIDAAKGRFIAFLDADDLWEPFKLELQISKMIESESPFCFSAYKVIDSQSKVVGHFTPPLVISYNSLLYGNVIGCLTAVYDREYFGTVKFPLLRKRQDFALWLALLKRCYTVAGLSNQTACYRKSQNSLSSNKIGVIPYQWAIYREIEGYSRLLSAWYFFRYLSSGLIKHLYSYCS